MFLGERIVIFDAQSAVVEAVLDKHGIRDPSRRRRVHLEAQRRLDERATKASLRALVCVALQGWRPPPSSCDVPEVPDDSPIPIRQDVYRRVVRWIRRAPGDFGVRDLMRGTGVETAADARAVLDGLIARGEVQVLKPPLRWPGDVGRPCGPRYRAVNGNAVNIKRPASDAIRDTVDADDLDWSFLSPQDHGIQKQ